MVAVIDYGVGNLFSLFSSLKSIGVDTILTSDKSEIEKADKILLPGVGAFGDAINKLKSLKLDEVIEAEVKKGKQLMGICLGMQMLFEKSYEYGEYEGLGLLKGSVTAIDGYINNNLKIPHIGWNSLIFKKPSTLTKYINEGDFVYFVHSYHAINCTDSVVAVAEYDKYLTAMVEKDNVCGCQFHPEKSGSVGLNILKAWCER